MIIGTRDSKLALAQTDIFIKELRWHHPDIDVEIKKIATAGDIDQISDMNELGGYGAFVRELDAALINFEIDVSVNSMKDIPVMRNEEIHIAAVLERASVEDVILPKELERLPKNAVVGSSSVRRTAVLKHLRPDIQVKQLRGNVPTRLEKLDRGEYDAIILAKAGLERLGIQREMYVLDPNVFVPAPAQGAIAIACRTSDIETIDIVKRMDHEATRRTVTVERTIMRMMGAGCSSPIGVKADEVPEGIRVRAVCFENGMMTRSDTIIPSKCYVKDLEKIVLDLKRNTQRGKAYLVGAGPGDPGLMTVKGLQLLRDADIVVYDALIDADVFKECPNAEKIDVGKRGGNHKRTQQEINRLLVELVKNGKNVVRLKGGDPFLFGRGAEEAAELRKEGLEVHVVPGVSSAISVPELAGIPITHRDHSSTVTFVTGHERSDRNEERIKWDSLAEINGTIVVLMGMSNSQYISKKLMEGGMDPETPVSVTVNGSTAEHRTETTTLSSLYETILKKGLEPPGIIVIGNVVKERNILGDMI